MMSSSRDLSTAAFADEKTKGNSSFFYILSCEAVGTEVYVSKHTLLNLASINSF